MNSPTEIMERFCFKVGFRFSPSPKEAITYYLPRLISGVPLRNAARLIHHADFYSCEPKDLASKFAPVPKSESGDRFFFTLCKRQKGSSTRSARAAGPGTWVSQKMKEITNDAGNKIGETKSFRFKKDGVNTDWLMEEYRCCLEQAVVGDAEQVLCKMYVSPRAPPGSAARQESAAALPQEPAPSVPTPVPRPQPVIAHAPKRPAPVAEPPCPKRMRGAVPTRPVVQPACVTAFAPPRPCCPPQRQAPLQTPLVPRRVMASCLPIPSVPTSPVVQGFVPRPAPACLPVAPHRPLTEAPAAAEDDDGFANFLEGVIEAEDVMPIEEGVTSQDGPAAEAGDDMDQFASSLEDMLDGTEDGTLPDDQQKPAAEADDDMEQYASSLEEDLMLAQTEEAADEQTAEGAEGLAAAAQAEEQVPSDQSATTLRDFLTRYAEMESEATAANELQKAFDVLNDLGDDHIDDAFLTVPLKDYGEQLFY